MLLDPGGGGINDSGRIVGSYDGGKGYLYEMASQNIIQMISAPGNAATFPFGINKNKYLGLIVGADWVDGRPNGFRLVWLSIRLQSV